MRKILIPVCIVLTVIIVAVLSYVIYLNLQYYRIEDNQPLTVESNKTQALEKGEEYSVLTYNIGFGAYTRDFSFFMDSGVMEDGSKVSGRRSVGKDKNTVIANTEGSLEAVKAQDTDFVLLQEVDYNSTRSRKVDQRRIFSDSLDEHGSSFAQNFHSGFLFYPIFSPHGIANSGLLTLSKYEISSAVRKSFPVDESFPTKFFDLDRCFAVNRIPVKEGGELVLINCHMSAYDEGGKIRARQLEVLNSFLTEEYEKGNYVIVGGDYNHAICNTVNAFECKQQIPQWVSVLQQDDLPDGFSVVTPENVNKVPTCRSTDMPYEKGVNYTVVIDGFIISDNLEASARNIDLDFAYSDHNPVRMDFRLK